MLEKLKALLGETFNEELGKKLIGEIESAYISKADHKTALAPLEDLKTQLKTANETIAGYKDMDIETIKQSAIDWQEKAEKAEIDAAARIADLQFGAALSKAVTSAKGKNEKAITALLDLETLKGSKNQEADVAAAIAEIQKSADYLFGDTTPPPPGYAAGTGSASVLTSQDNKTVADARAAAGLSEKKE